MPLWKPSRTVIINTLLAVVPLTFGYIYIGRIGSMMAVTTGQSDESTIVRGTRPRALGYLLEQQDRMELPRIIRHESADAYRMKVDEHLALQRNYPGL